MINVKSIFLIYFRKSVKILASQQSRGTDPETMQFLSQPKNNLKSQTFMIEFSKLLSLALLIKRIAITWNINSLENLQNAYICVCVFMRVKMEIKINGNGAGKKPIVFPHPHSIGINLETEIDITIAISHSLFRSYSYTHYEIKWSFCEAEKHPHVEVEQRQYFVERNQACLFSSKTSHFNKPLGFGQLTRVILS